MGKRVTILKMFKKTKQFLGSLSIFKFQHVSGYKELLNVLVKRMM